MLILPTSQNREAKLDDREPIRIDFVMEVISMNEETRMVEFKMKPNPERYEEYLKEGKRHYRDKYLNIVFSEDLIKQMADQMPGTPVFHSPPQINNSHEYALERKEAVQKELQTGEHQSPKNKLAPHVPIHTGNVVRDMVFISVDICKSTELRSKDPEKFDEALKIFIKELGTVVGQFNGCIHKMTGDGFIAYLDQPSFNTMCDNAIDMCLTLRLVLEESLNSAFKEKGLSAFNIRIGAEYGVGKINHYEIPATGYKSIDVTSDALNRAVKIQESGQTNQILIGRSLYEKINVQWLKRCNDIEKNLGPEVGLPEYKIYEVN